MRLFTLNNIIQKGLLPAVILFGFVWSCQQPAEKSVSHTAVVKQKTVVLRDSLTAPEKQLLQTGDVLLRKGFGWISNTIAQYLDEKYPITHCGLILRDSVTQKISILHTISNEQSEGMYIEPLWSYCRESQIHSLMAVRLKVSTREQQQIIAAAKRRYKQKIPFDMGFDDHDTTRLYCIEMLRDVYKEVLEKDILPKRTTKNGIDVLAMSNLLDTTHFELLFNHFEDKKAYESD